MFDLASHPAASVQSAAEAPVAGKVVFEIGAIIAIHLVVALSVTILLQAFAAS
jgi:hypothetical protein